MEGQPVGAFRTIRIRSRIPSEALSPRGLVARLLWAFSRSGRTPSYEDYRAARRGHDDPLDPESFRRLCLEVRPDPGQASRDHLFRPQLRDREGKIYQVLAISQNRIDLLREDGTTGTTTRKELDTCFIPIVQSAFARAGEDNDRPRQVPL